MCDKYQTKKKICQLERRINELERKINKMKKKDRFITRKRESSNPCEYILINEVLQEDELLIVRSCNTYRVKVEEVCNFCNNGGQGTETSWSKDQEENQSTCFIDNFPELNYNRWGWSNGPYQPNN